MKRVHFVVVLKNKRTNEIFLDTEVVEAETVAGAKDYLVSSFYGSRDYEFITCKVGKLITFDAVERIY